MFTSREDSCYIKGTTADFQYELKGTTADFQYEIKNLCVSEDSSLVTAHVVGFYRNIPHKAGIKPLKEVLDSISEKKSIHGGSYSNGRISVKK